MNSCNDLDKFTSLIGHWRDSNLWSGLWDGRQPSRLASWLVKVVVVFANIFRIICVVCSRRDAAAGGVPVRSERLLADAFVTLLRFGKIEQVWMDGRFPVAECMACSTTIPVAKVHFVILNKLCLSVSSPSALFTLIILTS